MVSLYIERFEALRLAQQRHQPARIRYDSKYAAMITTSVWRAKKHRALAAVARAEWQRARVALKGKLWLKHVKGHSGQKWNDRADKLADEGRCGVVRVVSPHTVDQCACWSALDGSARRSEIGFIL